MFKIENKSENYYEEELKSQKFDLSNFDFSKVVTQKDMLHYIDLYFNSESDHRDIQSIDLDTKDVLGYVAPEINCFQLGIDSYWASYGYLVFKFTLTKIYEDTGEDAEVIYGYSLKLDYSDDIFAKYWDCPLTKEARKALVKLVYEDLCNTFKASKS